MTLAAVRFKVVVLLSLINILLLLLLLCWGIVFGPCYLVQCLVRLSFFNHLAGEERAGCFTLITFDAVCLLVFCVSSS